MRTVIIYLHKNIRNIFFDFVETFILSYRNNVFYVLLYTENFKEDYIDILNHYFLVKLIAETINFY